MICPYSIIILSYLLAFVKLTGQVDNRQFLPGFDDFLMEFINFGLMYIRGEREGLGGGVGGGKG